MNNIYVLCNKDIPVAIFDQDNNMLRVQGHMPRDFDTLLFWLYSRCNSYTKKFYKSIGICSTLDYINTTHLVSMHDTFWVKRRDDPITWKAVSPYRHPHSKAVATFALENITLKNVTNNYFSPLPSTAGQFPHKWVRRRGSILFVKAGSKYTLPACNSGREPFSEYYASVIARYLGFDAVKYSIRNYKRSDGKIDQVTEYVCYTSEAIGAATANALGLDSYEEVLQYSKHISEQSLETALNMFFLDCLLLNTDRHFGNIKFLIDNETLIVKGITPIFDNNYAMLPRFMEEYDTLDRKEYCCSDGRSFEDLYALISKYKSFKPELKKLKSLTLTKPDNVSIKDSRLAFLNKFVQTQVNYLLTL